MLQSQLNSERKELMRVYMLPTFFFKEGRGGGKEKFETLLLPNFPLNNYVSCLFYFSFFFSCKNYFSLFRSVLLF